MNQKLLLTLITRAEDKTKYSCAFNGHKGKRVPKTEVNDPQKKIKCVRTKGRNKRSNKVNSLENSLYYRSIYVQFARQKYSDESKPDLCGWASRV